MGIGGKWSDESRAGDTGPSCGIRRPPAPLREAQAYGAGGCPEGGFGVQTSLEDLQLGGLVEFASSQDCSQLPGGCQDLGRENSEMWAADSGAVLVARPLGVETPRQRRPGL